MFANGSDTESGKPGNFVFPQPGRAAGWSDEVDARSTCFADVGVESGGTRIATAMLDPGYPIGVTVDLHELGDAVLTLAGCNSTARIPIDGRNLAAPTAAAHIDSAANMIEVVWEAPNAVTAQVFFWSGTYAELRHVVDRDSVQMFPPLPGVDVFAGIRVEALQPVIPVATDFGVVRVWRGASATASIDRT